MTFFLKRFCRNCYKINQSSYYKKVRGLLNRQEFPFSYQKLVVLNDLQNKEDKVDLRGEKPASLDKPASLEDERLFQLPRKLPIDLNLLFQPYRSNEKKQSEQPSDEVNKDVERLRNEIDETLKQNLFSWDNSIKWKFLFPNTIFVGDEPPVTFFKPKQEISTQDLSKLSSEQIQSISEKGEFLLNHSNENDSLGTIWKVNPWIVKGSSNITRTLYKNLSLSWKELYQIPKMLLPKYSYQYDSLGNFISPNFISGLRQISFVPNKLINLLIGCRKMEMKSDDQIMQELYKEYAQKVYLELNEDITKAFIEFVHQIDEDIKDPKNNKEKIQEQEKILAELRAFHQEFTDRAQKLQKERLKILETADIDENQGLFELLMDTQKLLFSMMDEKNLPQGIEARNHLKNLIKATQISMRHYQQLQDKIQEKRDGISSEIEKNHPIKFLVESWRNDNIEEQMKPIIQELTAEFNQTVLQELEKEGLKEQSLLFQKFTEFQRNSQENYNANFDRILKSTQKPSRVFKVFQNILGEYEIKKIMNSDGTAFYYKKTEKSIDIPSSFYGWRIALYLARWKAWTINSYDVLTQNLIDGPIGLKSLFKSQPFYTSYDVDSKTGEKKPSGKTIPYLELLRQIKAGIALSRKQFEDLPDRGIFGKNFARIFNYIECYIFRGLITGSIVAAGFPIVVLINSIVSGVLAVTSFLWIPAGLSLHQMVSILFLDMDSPTRDTYRFLNPYLKSKQTSMFLPLFQVFGSLALGVSESLLSLASATVALPTVSLLGAIFSYGRKAISTVTDDLMLGLIKKFGRQPELDSALAWKIRGTGVARQYFNSIQIDDVKFLVRSWMEKAELDEFESRLSKRINEPMNLYYSLVGGLLKQYGTSININTYLLDNSKDLETQLIKDAAKRRSVFPELSSSYVKFTEEELQKLLPACEEIIRSFIKARENMSWIFVKYNIENEDYKKLTELVLKEVFDDEEILFPFSEIDKRIEITSQKNTTYHAIMRSIDGECDLSVLASSVAAKYRKLQKTELCRFVDEKTIIERIRQINKKQISVTENSDPSRLCFYLPYWSLKKEQSKP